MKSDSDCIDLTFLKAGDILMADFAMGRHLMWVTEIEIVAGKPFVMARILKRKVAGVWVPFEFTSIREPIEWFVARAPVRKGRILLSIGKFPIITTSKYR